MTKNLSENSGEQYQISAFHTANPMALRNLVNLSPDDDSDRAIRIRGTVDDHYEIWRAKRFDDSAESARKPV